jgi:hypothetical protein
MTAAAYWYATGLAVFFAVLAAYLDCALHRARRDALAWRTVAARWHGEAEVNERLAEAWCALYEGAQAVTEAQAGR